MASKLLRAAVAQYLALGSTTEAIQAAEYLAKVDPNSSPVEVYEGQTALVSVTRASDKVVSVSAGSGAEERPCTVSANSPTGVYDCELENKVPLRRFERVDTIIRQADQQTTFKQKARPARSSNGLPYPIEGDTYLEGRLPADWKTDTPRLLRVRTGLLACPSGSNAEPPGYHREAITIVSPSETSFAFQLPEPLHAGETVVVSDVTGNEQVVNSLLVRPASPGLTPPGGRQFRVYVRVGADISGLLPGVDLKTPTPSGAATADWALVAPRVAHEACRPRLRDYFSVHAYVDSRIERVGFTRYPESDAEVSLDNERELGGVVEGGLYTPIAIPGTRWRYQGRAFSQFLAPLIKAGSQTVFLPHTTQVSGGPTDPFFAVGFRWGMQHYPTYAEAEGYPVGTEMLIGHLDFTIGKWRQFSEPVGDSDLSTPWRYEVRYDFPVPKIKPFLLPEMKLFVSGRINSGSGLPFDYQLFTGFRYELSRRVASKLRRWF